LQANEAAQNDDSNQIIDHRRMNNQLSATRCQLSIVGAAHEG